MLFSKWMCWSVDERRLGWSSPAPVLLSPRGMEVSALATSPLENRLFVVDAKTATQVIKLNVATRLTSSLFPDLGPYRVNFSRDGKWVVFGKPGAEGGLWLTRGNGTERMQLASGHIFGGRFSPDGQHVAFVMREPVGGSHAFKIYWVSVEGGALHELPTDVVNQVDVNWSIDGRSIIFGQPPYYLSESGEPRAIYISDLGTNSTSKLSGSDGWFSPRLSPDGRYLAALSLDQKSIGLFDFATRKWRKLVGRLWLAARIQHKGQVSKRRPGWAR